MVLNYRIFADKEWKDLDKKIVGNKLIFKTPEGISFAEATITQVTSYGPEGDDPRAYTGKKAEGQKTEPGTIDLMNMMGNYVLLISTGSTDTAACIKIDEVQYNGKKMRTGSFFKEVYKMDKSTAELIRGKSIVDENGLIRMQLTQNRNNIDTLTDFLSKKINPASGNTLVIQFNDADLLFITKNHPEATEEVSLLKNKKTYLQFVAGNGGAKVLLYPYDSTKASSDYLPSDLMGYLYLNEKGQIKFEKKK